MTIITSGQSNLTLGCIAAARGKFNHIRYAAPMGPHLVYLICIGSIACCPLLSCYEYIGRFHLKIASSCLGIRNSCNTVPRAHPSPQPEQHHDRFSRFCTASQSWQTDWHTTLIHCSNRLAIATAKASAAMQPKNTKISLIYIYDSYQWLQLQILLKTDWYCN